MNTYTIKDDLDIMDTVLRAKYKAEKLKHFVNGFGTYEEWYKRNNHVRIKEAIIQAHKEMK